MDESVRTSRRAILSVSGATLASLAGCFGVTESETEGSSDGESGGTESDGGTEQADLLSAPVAGDPDADVTVAVYEDFACPHCATFNEDVYPQLRSEYVESEQIRYEHHDFPIPVNQTVSWQAPNAARAVQSTVGDDAFFEYTDRLFANQGSLEPNAYAALAEEVGAEPSTVKTAATDREYDATVKADRERGLDAGVTGTPTAFVNGEEVQTTAEALTEAIDAAVSDST
jgi:protein-disulfide isomerase